MKFEVHTEKNCNWFDKQNEMMNSDERMIKVQQCMVESLAKI